MSIWIWHKVIGISDLNPFVATEVHLEPVTHFQPNLHNCIMYQICGSRNLNYCDSYPYHHVISLLQLIQHRASFDDDSKITVDSKDRRQDAKLNCIILWSLHWLPELILDSIQSVDYKHWGLTWFSSWEPIWPSVPGRFNWFVHSSWEGVLWVPTPSEVKTTSELNSIWTQPN